MRLFQNMQTLVCLWQTRRLEAFIGATTLPFTMNKVLLTGFTVKHNNRQMSRKYLGLATVAKEPLYYRYYHGMCF